MRCAIGQNICQAGLIGCCPADLTSADQRWISHCRRSHQYTYQSEAFGHAGQSKDAKHSHNTSARV